MPISQANKDVWPPSPISIRLLLGNRILLAKAKDYKVLIIKTELLLILANDLWWQSLPIIGNPDSVKWLFKGETLL